MTMCKDDCRSELCEIWKRKETKFDHYNFTGLTEQNIQSNFHSVLEICRMVRPRAGHVFSNLAAQITLTIHCNS